jgi:hypothetical protein
VALTALCFSLAGVHGSTYALWLGAASLKLSAQIINCAILFLVKSGTLSLITDLQRAIKA